MLDIHFSDFFRVSPVALEEYGAFNVSLINDLPLFIDPFLLFNSKKPEYQNLHHAMIQYLRFLRNKSLSGLVDQGGLRAWFTFSEVKQNWLGFSRVGNQGRGLGHDFAVALNSNLHSIFANFGREGITKGSHLEKLCLISSGVGRDNISDFTTNLIKDYLLKYTQTFSEKHIDRNLLKKIPVERVRFNYATETWESDTFILPYYDQSYILLTPKDMLTKDDIWISKSDLFEEFDNILPSISNEQLRSQINNYFALQLPRDPKREDIEKAIVKLIAEFPEFIDYYIRYKEDRGDEAVQTSIDKVHEIHRWFVEHVQRIAYLLGKETFFYERWGDTYQEAKDRVLFLKHFIENADGYRLFYLDNQPIKRETDLQLLFRLTWFATPSDVNREVNNGRGPVDYKISRGNLDKSLVEFKLASNSQLKRNLEKTSRYLQGG